MIYAYVRCSTDAQDVASQKYGIEEYCKRHNLEIECWTEEYVSGTKAISKRKLGNELQEKLKKGDVIVCGELSRLSRKMFLLFNFLQYCLEHEIVIRTVKENYVLGNDLQSSILAFAFGIAAQIERDMISQRTKEALARKKAEGVILGRPKGRKSTMIKLDGFSDEEVADAIMKNPSITQAANALGVHRATLTEYIKNRHLTKIVESRKDAFSGKDCVRTFWNERKELIIALFFEGKTRREICAELGVKFTTTGRLFNEKQRAIVLEFIKRNNYDMNYKAYNDILHSKYMLQKSNNYLSREYNVSELWVENICEFHKRLLNF